MLPFVGFSPDIAQMTCKKAEDGHKSNLES